MAVSAEGLSVAKNPLLPLCGLVSAVLIVASSPAIAGVIAYDNTNTNSNAPIFFGNGGTAVNSSGRLASRVVADHLHFAFNPLTQRSGVAKVLIGNSDASAVTA